ncbi:MAG TPA: NAD-dependent epimerase/dehydratase family protein [Ktedonobacteraceae bacterium]|nr:NAD-dependent epimerase/dehydratase family protein [Ktedonobacteraceae bacterium]
MRCLVTGVAGFVGSHLAERLLADGHQVCGIDSFVDYYPRPIKEANLESLRSSNRFTFIEGDLLAIDLPPLLEGVDLVFHQAAQAGVRASWGHEFSRYVDCNVLATQRLLEASLHARSLQRFVYASSSSVYGETLALPVSEAVNPRPISPYGVSKLAAEHLCTLYHHNFGVPTVSLRYFTVYGPRQRPDMAFHRFCKAILHRQPVRMYDNGYQTRDFTYISDVVEANIRAATRETAIGQVMNIAGGSRVTLHDVITILQEIHGSPINIVFEEKRHGDVRHTFADTSRAQQIIGYQPLVALRQGLYHEFQHLAALYQYGYATLV